jgi:site-specific recombinase XerD
MNAHSFRHRVGHHIIKSGGSSADVMNILGHSSVQSTTIYTMMSDLELEKRYRYFMEEPAQEKSRVVRTKSAVGKSA